jgi:hypothetical protein
MFEERHDARRVPGQAGGELVALEQHRLSSGPQGTSSFFVSAFCL